jgi:dienelactone hydrolase
MLDTLQLGEIPGIHHGTYREGRWWWLSRGYTPAGVECWNGMRGIDYLISRPDVDPDRIGVTGISGGGAATFWIAAADERVKVAVPVSGLTDLSSYVSDHVVNGHCDCMFLYNTYQWPWARIPSLIAPRPLLYINSDQDSLFPIEGDERVINRLERVYSLFGAGDVVDSLVSIGGHAYRQDIRQGAFRFLNTYLKSDPRPVLDTEVDLVTGDASAAHPIPPEQLRVFPRDTDLPTDAHNGRIDQEFVPMWRPGPPKQGMFTAWRDDLLGRLRKLTFHHFPNRIAPARPVGTKASALLQLETEPGITVPLRQARAVPASSVRRRVWLVAADLNDPDPTWWKAVVGEPEEVYVIQPRGVGDTRWTQKNPPNYVERAHYLLGRTVDSGRIWDLVAAARYLKGQGDGRTTICLAGAGAAGVLAAYAALIEPDIDEVLLFHPPTSHMDASAPALLNVLRVCDIPDVVGMLAPRPVTLLSDAPDWHQVSGRIYQIAGAEQKLSVRSQ